MRRIQLILAIIATLIVGDGLVAQQNQDRSETRKRKLAQQDQRAESQREIPSEQRNRRRARGPRGDAGLKVGEMAPDFDLKSFDGKSSTKLAAFRGKRPVVLFFGSYT